MRSLRILYSAWLVLSCCTLALGARVRPGGDPTKDRILWADPFDNYTQWAYDYQSDAAYQPNGTLWEGGPMPPCDAGGLFPYYYPTGGSKCDTDIQTTPSLHEMAREQWLSHNCPTITSPGGVSADPAPFDISKDENCGVSGEWFGTMPMYARLNYTWGMGDSYMSMGQFTHTLTDRIQGCDNTANAVKGTDENPLILIFYYHDGFGGNRSLYNNMYVELCLGDDRAPTDYIWRGDPSTEEGHPCTLTEPDNAECCPQGPYPIICQQVRQENTGNGEDYSDVTYLNNNCPPLETKTWKSIAFGWLAIMDKNPCKYDIATAHLPTMNHFCVFDGNVWREIRGARYRGLKDLNTGLDLPADGNTRLSWRFEDNMALGSETSSCADFTVVTGLNQVIVKITTNWILIYVETIYGTDHYWHAAVPRAYLGGFDRISMGVGQGCELDLASYTCKTGGTPTQCLTYSQPTPTGPVGYNRTQIDAMNLFDGELYFDDYVDPVRACCHTDYNHPLAGQCEELVQSACQDTGDIWHPDAVSCNDILCCVDPFADADHDGDVDLTDFGMWQTCFSGTGNAHPAGYPCKCFNRDAEVEDPDDVDETDFNDFYNCWSGPTVPASTTCDD